jgi:solute carrier family 27 fatty acid transporter 1/4
LSNKIAEYFYNQSYQKKDTIALMMENSLEYPFFWLGLSKIGVISALINTNLRKDTLIHSIKVANCKAIITTPDYIEGALIY